jgi:sec-independent protein translocase protein TatA
MGRMPELILILVVFVLLFGAQKLPEIGAALGKAIREFKKNIRDVEEEVKKPIENQSK